jgi:hypothetical protein
MKLALDEAGFDSHNEDHWIITCGDHFDRGRKPAEVMRYLQKLPRKILVKGNHEQLLVDCIDRGYALSHDYSNGTFNTIADLAPSAEVFDVACCTAHWRTKDFIDSMVDYFETKNYIFVHSWVPLISKDGLPAYFARSRDFKFKQNWRESSSKEWENSRWDNPFELAEQSLLPDKTVVFGHWHCSTGWAKAEGRSEFGDDAKFEPYYGDGFIAIDACTAHSGKVNVLIIEDEFLEE